MKEEDKEPERKEINNETVAINMSDTNIIISDLWMGEERNTDTHKHTHNTCSCTRTCLYKEIKEESESQTKRQKQTEAERQRLRGHLKHFDIYTIYKGNLKVEVKRRSKS